MFNSDGVIQPGFHNYYFDDFEKHFVHNFNTSQTRSNILSNSLKWISDLGTILNPVEIWFDGSFSTTKINPNDLDIVVFYDNGLLTKPISDQLQKHRASCKSHNCDAYYAIINNNNAAPSAINQRNYWRGQFGFDKFDTPKGIIVMPWEEIVKGINKAVIK